LADHHPLVTVEKPQYANVPMASVSSRYRYAVAVRSDGTLWSWGQNFFGELGNGTRVEKYYPAQIGSGADWASATTAVENGFSLGIKTDGTLWAWGSNF
jgi:alpha-tubulin suppressor-like RCC1 family protein